MSLGVFIDGDNLSHTFVDDVQQVAAEVGPAKVARVYGNSMTVLKGWEKHGWLLPIYTGAGKNSSDILLGLDAISLAYTTSLDTIVIASSDADFFHLATRLRESGRHVIGVGEAKAPQRYRDSCSEFRVVTIDAAVTKIDQLVRKVIADSENDGPGITLKALGSKMGQLHKVSIKTRPEKTWRAYLEARPDLFEIKSRDGEDHVFFLKKGFRDKGELG